MARIVATGLGADPVLSKNPIDAVRRADSTLDARRVATFVTRREPLLGSPRMSPFPQVLQFLVVAVAGWINQQPRDEAAMAALDNQIVMLPRPIRARS